MFQIILKDWKIKKKKLTKLIYDFNKKKKIIIGICLGMQLLMTTSEEFGKTEGLNLIHGSVKKIPYFEKDFVRYSVPNVGWRHLLTNKKNSFEKFLNNKKMNFIHSYYVKVENKKNVLAETKYGKLNFCSAVNHNNVYGFQFHPEKSGNDGILIYKKILK